jgi:hypothetical protein
VVWSWRISAGATLDEHLNRAVRASQELDDAPDGPHLEDIVGRRLSRLGLLLSAEQDLFVCPHRLFHSGDALLTPYEERHDHVREDHRVAERQQGDQALVAVLLIFTEH